MRGKATCPKRIRFAREGYTSGSFTLKVTLFPRTMYLSQEIVFISNRTSLRKMPTAYPRARRLAWIVDILGK